MIGHNQGMSFPSLDLAARAALGQFAVRPSGVTLIGLGNRGGFSGARLWRLEGEGGPYCLRAWPAQAVSSERLESIHRLMTIARQAGLSYVPAVFRAATGATWVEHSGRHWDLTRWLPGRADFHEQPARARLEAACEALARLHLAWGESVEREAWSAKSSDERSTFRAPRFAPCPAVGRRLECYRDWVRLRQSGWQPALDCQTFDPVGEWAVRAWRLLHQWAGEIPRRLGPWADRPFPLQPCLCDIWHDHVLYEGNTVTGLVDYGSVKMDNVAVDLARLLGSLVGDELELRNAGLQAYARCRPLAEEETALAAVLDFTGTLLAAANWLKWLYREERIFEDRQPVSGRLAALVQRIEKWQVPGPICFDGSHNGLLQ
jgi:Ser/Thr protein kinase RdoA (MazF antagonist)